ncbi:methylmalonyl-CoA epimerase [Actinopolymorpha pittospori]|uniref:Methylmalonyl-CoA/ethylmalonyl-CoA epimerase n=1 Tax=Actinopolymorpha pittospori TaxID=648752 RepID=A0A927NB17_9ACTN|nr:methylmalonyl-CoA/ethylmalonyl-CoA epimerase [Actinopolymorpha pittospori]
MPADLPDASSDGSPESTESSGSASSPSSPPQPMFRSIDHVGIAVTDLDAAIAWYAEKFGMRVTHTEVNEEQGVREAMLAVGTSGPQLQLLAPLRPDSPVGRFLASRGEGLHQVAYTVDDVDAASAALRERDIELLYDEPRRGTAGSRVNFIHPKNAGGFLVELVEPPAEADDTREIHDTPNA